MNAVMQRSGLTLPVLGLPVVLALVLTLLVPEFLQLGNWRNLGHQVAGLVIAASGQLLVALVAGIDLSLGSVISLTSAIVVTVPNPWAALALALLAGAAVGLVNGLGVVVTKVHPLVMTLSTATFVQGLALLVLPTPGGRPPAAIAAAFEGELLGVSVSLCWSLAVAAVLWWVLHRTRFGLHLYATGAHARSVELSGVNSAAVVVGAYVGCSLLAVLAGLLLTTRIGSGDPNLGLSYGLDSVTAIALGGVQLIGGRGSVLGVLTGSLALGLVSNGVNLFGVSPFLRGTITGVLLVVAVAAQRRKGLGL